MPAQEKIQLLEKYAALLDKSPNIIFTRYQGLSVAQLDVLRQRLKQQGVVFTVVKNNIFRIALAQKGLMEPSQMDSTLVGPLAVVFAKTELPQAAKVLKEFKKEHEALAIVAGVLDKTYYDANGIESLAGLPSREELLAKIAGSLNAPASQIAGLVNNIMASLARAIKAVGEKNG